MAAAKKEHQITATPSIQKIEIPAIEIERIDLTVIGDSPLIVHKWSQKAKLEILSKQTGKATKAKERKNPIRDYVQSMYWLDENGFEIEPPEVNDYTTDDEGAAEYERIQEIVEESHFGFPATAFKASMIDAAYQQNLIGKKTTVRGAIHISGEFVEIEGTPQMREDMVKVGAMTKTADIRYRGEFRNWKATIHLLYNKNAVTPSQIANMLNYGGFGCGVGEWRVSRDGEFGRYHIQAS